MKTRYAVTHINSQGLRVLTFANQGRNHYDTQAEAEKALEFYKPDLRAKILGEKADTLKVLPVECYDHGDATRTVFGFD